MCVFKANAVYSKRMTVNAVKYNLETIDTCVVGVFNL